jgi:hypothetical protein
MSSMKTDRVAGYVRRSSMRNSLPDVRVFEQQRQRPEKIELMYIQSNAHSAKEVRLMAREEVQSDSREQSNTPPWPAPCELSAHARHCIVPQLEASQRSPGAADLRRTISNRLPRNVPPPVVRSHSVLGLVPTATDSGADWARGSLERSGAARRGSGVHWAGGVGVSVGVDRTEQRAARRSDDAASWARGGAFDGTPDSRSASRRGSMRGTVCLPLPAPRRAPAPVLGNGVRANSRHRHADPPAARRQRSAPRISRGPATPPRRRPSGRASCAASARSARSARTP